MPYGVRSAFILLAAVWTLAFVQIVLQEWWSGMEWMIGIGLGLLAAWGMTWCICKAAALADEDSDQALEPDDPMFWAWEPDDLPKQS